MNYILDVESWVNLQMKILDAPGIGKKRKKIINSDEELRDFLKI